MPGRGPKSVKIDPNGGDVSVEIFFGFNQYGEYSAYGSRTQMEKIRSTLVLATISTRSLTIFQSQG